MLRDTADPSNHPQGAPNWDDLSDRLKPYTPKFATAIISGQFPREKKMILVLIFSRKSIDSVDISAKLAEQ